MAASTTYSGGRNHRYFSGETELPPATIPTTIPANLMFEFNEFDIWNNVASSPEFHKTCSKKPLPSPENRREVRTTPLSLPVDVPDWSMILKKELTENRKGDSDADDGDFDDDLYGDDHLIPPHEYLAKVRIASFSVHEGIGRTLKGRDLSRVRNAVWKIIGFED